MARRSRSGRSAGEREPSSGEQELYAEDELLAEEEGLPEEEEEEFEGPPSRWLVLTSSYGLSALIHIALLLMFLFIYWTESKPPETEAKILPSLEQKKQEYDPTKKRALHRRPEIQHPEEVQKPIKELEEEVVKTEQPKGTSFDNLANKNLDSESANDAFGVAGGAAGAYGSRFGKGKASRHGGSAATESAVLAALWWLQRHQDADGRWAAAEFHKNCKRTCEGPDYRQPSGRGPGLGVAEFDVGVTGLALLAFLGDGHTHRASPYPEFRRAVFKGLSYLKRIQKEDGSIGYSGKEQSIYNHVLATMALAEAYFMSKDFTLQRVAQKAVDWLVAAQNPGAGWKYEPRGGKNDTSVTGWAVLALKTARTADLKVPDEAFAGALAWFERATSDGGPGKPPGLVGYMQPGDGGSTLNRNLKEAVPYPEVYPVYEGAPTMTAVGVICRIFTGQKRTHERIKQGIKILMSKLPSWEPDKKTKNETNFYYWYYGTYAVFHGTPLDSREWDRWNKAMQQALLGDGTNRQRMGGDEDGSWDPVGEWAIAGGRVYATAINALTLEIYYRYEHAKEGAGL
ncbi:MAG: hypothetical protein KatS3mg102_1048 [Planctomycetota bacterium]|nr:MAG: hypothetical protein KatS3mg102_1048 [Planctomycetota bacterium]